MTSDHTGLRVRQARNGISVREKPVIDRFHGTLVNPKPLELPVQGGVIEFTTRLGYESLSASDFWWISVPRKSHLRVDRISDDIYAVHVGVALLDGNNRRVAPLVQSASGKGEVVTVERGEYKIVAALGMPVALKPLTLQLEVIAVAASIQGLGVASVIGFASLRNQHLVALGSFSAGGQGAINRNTLHGEGTISLEFGGESKIGVYRKYTKAIGVLQVQGLGNISAFNTPRMVAPGGDAGIWAQGKLATITWANEPMNRRRAWFDADGVTVVLNRAYVDLDADPYTVWARLEQIIKDLYPPPAVPVPLKRTVGGVFVGGLARLSNTSVTP